MMKKLLEALLLAVIVCPTAAIAASQPPSPEVAEKPAAAPPAKHSFLDPIEGFARDSILHPTSPFELVPGKDPNGWSFVLEPYLWALGISGKTGVGGFPPVDVNVSSKKLLQNLDWAIMGMGEIHKGRWGLLADGYYAALSGSGNLEGVFYKDGTLQLQQAIASLSLAYRIIDDRRGFLDVYAGARYNYLGLQVDTTVDSGGIDSFSERLTDRLASGIDAKVSSLLAAAAGIGASDLTNAAKLALTTKTLETFADLPRPVREALRDRDVRRILRISRGPFTEYLASVAALKVAQAKGAVTSALEADVAAKKKKLATQLSSDIQNSLPTHISGDEWWVDPIIGLRGQINITRWLFLAGQGDVGGFGAGSQITWNTQATVGFNFTRNIFAEIGYRYMYVDYNKNNFLYQMNQYGLFSSLGVKF